MKLGILLNIVKLHIGEVLMIGIYLLELWELVIPFICVGKSILLGNCGIDLSERHVTSPSSLYYSVYDIKQRYLDIHFAYVYCCLCMELEFNASF